MKPSRLFASLPVRCAVLTTVAALTGCAYMTGAAPEWESRFGDASRQMTAAQVIDPQAPARNKDIQGVDGKAAAGVVRAYAESYGYGVKEPKPPALTLTTTGAQ
jgi:type IV pilus biogenesis protein CpaD/CtpE